MFFFCPLALAPTIRPASTVPSARRATQRMAAAIASRKGYQARDFASPEVQSQTDAQLGEIITNGKDKMPAYKGKLTADQIKGLIAYIRELAKKK